MQILYPVLPFLSDEDLFRQKGTMVSAVQRSKMSVESNPYRGVIDPFSALVDASIQGLSFVDWMQQEKARKIQKALQNALGDFHQNIIGSMPGWINAGQGGSYDVRNDEKRIIAEIKNKYNTLNSEGFVSVYDKLSNHLDYGDKEFTAYYVAIVAKNARSYREPFTPVKKKVARPRRDDLLKIDGKNFYALASSRENGLHMLYEALPLVLLKLNYRMSVTEAKSFTQLFTKAFLEK